MAQNDILKRYLDAGQDFVRELVKAGEVQREQAEKWIDDLVERNRKQGEELVNLVRREVAEQLKNLGLEDLAKRTRPAKGAAGKAAAAPKDKPVKAGPLATTGSGQPVGAKASAPAKKAPAKKAAAKKAAAPATPARGEAAALGLKKAAPKKAAAKKSATAKKTGPTA